MKSKTTERYGLNEEEEEQIFNELDKIFQPKQLISYACKCCDDLWTVHNSQQTINGAPICPLCRQDIREYRKLECMIPLIKKFLKAHPYP